MIEFDALIVRRCLDKRPHIIVPDGGLQLQSRCHVQNCAQHLLLAVDHPETSKGQRYNVQDEHTPTIAQWIEMICDALGHKMELVNLPYELAQPACHPITKGSHTFHYMLGKTKAAVEIGYTDAISMQEGVRSYAHWLVEHMPVGDDWDQMQDPLDYAAEDATIAAWKRGDIRAMKEVFWKQVPGWGRQTMTIAPNPFDGSTQAEKHENAGVYDPTKGMRDGEVAHGVRAGAGGGAAR